MHTLEEKARKALDLVIAFEDAEQDHFKELVMGQIGKELLAVFWWYANAMFPDNPEEDINDLVHLMIIGYLIKSNELESLFPDKDMEEE